MASVASMNLCKPVAIVQKRSAKGPTVRGVAPKAVGLPSLSVKPTTQQSFNALARSTRSRKQTSALQATSSMDMVVPAAQEIAQVANMGEEISQVAVTMTFIVLIGLVVGFVLLRVEAVVEDN
eukprot:CAMPEP_0197852694 /NCGR_PEP_ID=MMETSP1438-20131217/21228_1 /TAXON_ID=1461541 /ORGANISM="Pterosperma sp., Strain CCMP1384" /LENGTH=122 /DNA_ID=CAMNT_0043466855 /DNA_START=91 /DNA_END=459 /DNA_ORIENTATION=-